LDSFDLKELHLLSKARFKMNSDSKQTNKPSSDSPRADGSIRLLVTQWITSCCGLGFLPRAPGTWGSLGALLFWAVLSQNTATWWPYLILLSLSFAVGVWAIHLQGEGDKSSIVIDEWVGMGIALSTCTFWWPELIIGFVLFRFFDIAKPLGIRWLDRQLKSAWGVMLDDVLAGVYSALVLGGITYSGVLHELFGSWYAH
jgi:phosphatidylglycerophosphatase A